MNLLKIRTYHFMADMSKVYSQWKYFMSKDIIIKIMIDLDWKDLRKFIRVDKTIYEYFKSPDFRKLVINKRRVEFPNKKLLGDPVTDYYKTKMGMTTEYVMDIKSSGSNEYYIYKKINEHDPVNYHSICIVFEGNSPEPESIYYITFSSIGLPRIIFKTYVSVHEKIEDAYDKLYSDWEEIFAYSDRHAFIISKPPDMKCIKDVPDHIPINTRFKYESIPSNVDRLYNYNKYLIRVKFP